MKSLFKHQIIAITFLSLGLFGPAMADSASPGTAENEAIFQSFVGLWVSNEPAFGMSAETTMVWAPTLGGKFYRIDYRIEMQGPSEEISVFEGIGFYPAGKGKTFKAFWADNTGDLHPISAEHEGNVLTVIWGRPETELGRTRYELISPDQMKVTDWILTPDGWQQFNQKNLTRTGE